MTLSSEVEDAKAMIDYVKSLDYIDSSKIALLGVSMGGAVASMAAGELKDDISTLCLWCPAACVSDHTREGFIQNMPIDEESKKRGYVDLRGLKVGMGFVEDALEIDIYKKALPFEKNVLLVHGDADFIVPIEYSKKYLDIYGNRARLVEIKGANHSYDNVEHIEELTEVTLEFLKKELL